MRLSAFLACAAAAPVIIAASEPVRLQPSSPWNVDYAENSCRLIRTFGEGKTRTVLMFESGAPGEMDLLLVGNPVESYSEKVAARFLPNGGKEFVGQTEQAANREPAILWSTVYLAPDAAIASEESRKAEAAAFPDVRPPAISLAERESFKTQRQQFADKATELEVAVRPNHPVILETGSMGEPLRAFDKCSRDSLKDWGVDPDLEDKIVRPAWAAAPSRWFSSADYPVDMIRSDKESDVTVRLLVDASGRVTKCTSLSHFDAPEFNTFTCNNIMKRARLEPAELADGTRVPSYYTQRIVFRMGK